MARCSVCFRHCEIEEGKTGFCGGRSCEDGKVIAANYGRITSLALDPIEKKPLNRFYPGNYVLSVGSYGCNLRCQFCQNYSISWSDEAMAIRERTDYISPDRLAETALKLKDRGNIGLAFTYNEPLIGYEYVRDCATLTHEMGMKNVMVSNGTAELTVLDELLPYIDAMNIDLKGFTEGFYKTVGGDLNMVKAFIEHAAMHCHVEVTTLIIPGENDSEDEMRQISSWLSGLGEIPLHISRFFPRFKMMDRNTTDVSLVYSLADIARENLKYVYTGNC